MISINSTDGGAGFIRKIQRTGGTASGGSSPKIKREETFGSVFRGTSDIIEISGCRPESSGSVLKETKENIMNDISRDANPGKLDNLKNLIASGSYSVSPDDLAQILSE